MNIFKGLVSYFDNYLFTELNTRGKTLAKAKDRNKTPDTFSKTLTEIVARVKNTITSNRKEELKKERTSKQYLADGKGENDWKQIQDLNKLFM